MEQCKERVIVIEDVTKCTEHPFSYVLGQLKCAYQTGQEYSIKVPSGTVPFNVLRMYAERYNVEMIISDEGSFTTFVFRPRKREKS